jgi:heme/copper-type cytochrome/quinol oxidase subunit 2
MTQMIKRHCGKMFAAGFAAGAMVFAVMAFTTREPPNVQQRELVLITKEVAFRSPDRPGQPNPVLTLKKGEPVKLVLRNEESASVLHCFIISGLNVKTTRSLSTGESETLTFTPKEKGTFAYACLMHPNMSGKVVVE